MAPIIVNSVRGAVHVDAVILIIDADRIAVGIVGIADAKTIAARDIAAHGHMQGGVEQRVLDENVAVEAARDGHFGQVQFELSFRIVARNADAEPRLLLRAQLQF